MTRVPTFTRDRYDIAVSAFRGSDDVSSDGRDVRPISSLRCLEISARVPWLLSLYAFEGRSNAESVALIPLEQVNPSANASQATNAIENKKTRTATAHRATHPDEVTPTSSIRACRVAMLAGFVDGFACGVVRAQEFRHRQQLSVTLASRDAVSRNEAGILT